MLLTNQQYYEVLRAFGGARFAEMVAAEHNRITRETEDRTRTHRRVCSYCGRRMTSGKSCPGCGA